MEINTSVYRGVELQPRDQAGNINPGVLAGDACMRQIENGNGAPMGTEFPTGRKAALTLENAHVENMQPAGVPGKEENRFGIDLFLRLIQASGENDKRQIVMYNDDELTGTRQKRGHTAGVQLGQPGRIGTFKAGLARNAKTWESLETALKQKGFDLSEGELNSIFGEDRKMNKPMTVRHLKVLKNIFRLTGN